MCVFADCQDPPAVIHNGCVKSSVVTNEVFVHYREPKTGHWTGAAKVLFNGRGYVCVDTPTGPLWVLSKWTRAAINHINSGISQPDCRKVDGGEKVNSGNLPLNH